MSVEFPKIKAPAYREIDTHDVSPSDDLRDALVTGTPQQAWNALQKGADPGAYAYCFAMEDEKSAISLMAVKRDNLANEREPDVYYYTAAYIALNWHVLHVSQGRRDLLQPEIEGIKRRFNRPSLEAARSAIEAKTSYRKTGEAPDMLDLSYALIQAGDEPEKIPTHRRLGRGLRYVN